MSELPYEMDKSIGEPFIDGRNVYVAISEPTALDDRSGLELCSGCEYCAFIGNAVLCGKYYCSAGSRLDFTSVIFKKMASW
jgi:hypothetical protein